MGGGKTSYCEANSFKYYNEFFCDRLAQSFPGVRGIKWFTEEREIIKRIEILLKEPLCINGGNNPIWWFRGPLSMQIEKFQIISEEKFLMNCQECVVDKVCVYRSRNKYKSFIYVELKAEKTVGLYDYCEGDVLGSIKVDGYASEEYGVYNDYLLTREELDDGAKFIDGQIINFTDKDVMLRHRFLSRYNFIICAISNPINLTKNDSVFRRYLDGMINGVVKIDEIVKCVEELPLLRDRI